MERNFNKGDIVQHFKRETMTEEQLKKNLTYTCMKLLGLRDILKIKKK